jgi:alpha-amylase
LWKLLTSFGADRLRDISKPHDIEAWVGFDFPSRGNQYSSQKLNQAHFTAYVYCTRDYVRSSDNYLSADWDHATHQNGIFRFAHKRWARDVYPENGNADFLLLQDVDLAHPEVVTDTKNWGVWITRELGLRGFRLDAAKHMSARYMYDWVTHLRRECGDDLFIVGEYCVADGRKLAAFIRKMGRCMALIDDPLYHNFVRLSREERGDLRRVLDNSLVAHERELAVVSDTLLLLQRLVVSF